MTTKTANVLACVVPDIKEKTEEIMTTSIPFTLAVSSVPMARDEMNTTAFNIMMQNGFDDAKADRSRISL